MMFAGNNYNPRPGNWNCVRCHFWNFPSKRQCHRCSYPRVVQESINQQNLRKPPKTNAPSENRYHGRQKPDHSRTHDRRNAGNDKPTVHRPGRDRPGQVSQSLQNLSNNIPFGGSLMVGDPRNKPNPSQNSMPTASRSKSSMARGNDAGAYGKRKSGLKTEDVRRHQRGSHSSQNLNQNSSNEGKEESSSSKLSGQRKKRENPIGYKTLEAMLNMHPENIILQLQMENSGYDILLDQPEDITPEKMCLLLKVLSRAAETHVNRESLNMVFAKTFKHNFINHLIRFSLTLSLRSDVNESMFEYFENMWLVLDTCTHAMPSLAMNHLFELIDCCLMCLNRPSGNPRQDLIEKFVSTKCYLEDEKQKWSSREHYEPRTKHKSRYLQIIEQQDDLQPPDNFRHISVIPMTEELRDVEMPFLRRNIIQGKYEDVDHYLDVQFRLLREDFVRPLRNGIQELKENVNSRTRDLYVYRDVKLLNADVKNFTLIHNVQLTLPKHFKFVNSKRFMYGNLVCLSSDNFETVYFGSVSEKSVEMLRRGIIGVKFDTEIASAKSKTFIMVESRSFFTAYKHVLSALQNITEDDFPMKDFIVYAACEMPLPEYLNVRSRYDLQVMRNIRMMKDSEVCSPLFRSKRPTQNINAQNEWPVLQGVRITNNIELWPTCVDLGIDESQRRALKSALSSKLSIIQGPPGTGKTFMGLKIAQVLLHNSACWKKDDQGSPILVVCFTNHALDQFLEGLTQFTNSIVRVGSRTKSEIIQDFQINSLIKLLRVRRALPKRLCKINSELITFLRQLEVKVRALRQTLYHLRNPSGIIKMEDLLNEHVMPSNIDYIFRTNIVNLRAFLLDPGFFHVIENQLSATPSISKGSTVNDGKESEEDDWQDAIDFYAKEENERKLEDDDFLEDVSSNTAVCGTLNYDISVEALVREINDLYEVKDKTTVTEIPLFDAVQQEIKLNVLEKNFELLKYGLSIHPDGEMAIAFEKQNILRLPLEHRWMLYRLWLQRMAEKVAVKLEKLEKEYEQNANMFKEIKDQEYLHVMRHASVVGMTTTGAAQHTQILQALQPAIVIVEEAAEILEAHVLTSLTKQCQHLIMIGDHQQLQPSATVYELAKYYGLETSLFERLIKNNVAYETLEYQHRMRPNISRLLVPSIYPTLKDHDSVHKYPHIKGMEKDIFFMTHDHHEDKGKDDNNSKANTSEAEFIMALCRHLMLQGYSTDDITVLTPYSGQFFVLKRIQKRYEECEGVRISVVDNFQGEESNIILLSLVRSNEEGIVGFLKKENRVCVALSRAKKGLYIIGNMTKLKNSSDLWEKISEDLLAQNSIGDSIVLKCENHPEILSSVSSGEQILTASPEGGCRKLCTAALPECGHNCPKVCHTMDPDHLMVKCPLPCPKINCERNHQCPLKCWMDCRPCSVRVSKQLPCGHVRKVKCSDYEKEHKCPTPVERVLPHCQHNVSMMCCDDPAVFPCPIPCDIRLPCGHKCTINCHVTNDPDHLEYQCKQPCPRSPEGCSQEHKCERACYEDCGPCIVQVKKKAECGHILQIRCSVPVEDVECNQKCKRMLPCDHHCPKKCKDPCGGCMVKVKKTVEECQHEIKVECSVPAVKSKCVNSCMLNLPCGHKCQTLCKDPCTTECKVPVNSNNTCPKGHQIKVPCYLQGKVSGEDAWIHCSEPCGAMLSCGHYCKGNCSLCLHGRLHTACSDRCERQLVCGHKCKADCGSACPPCQVLCPMRCEHSRCGKKCGEPCTPCQEKCRRNCEHQKCERPCRVKCAQILCEKPCQKLLPCGHPCIGFCGDPCPPLCRTCNAEEIAETARVFGNEDNADTRYVLLEDCGHVIEARGLRGWLSQKNEEIGMKLCPRCKEPIYNNRRNLEYILQIYDDVRNIKYKYYSKDPKQQLQEISKLLEETKGISYIEKEVEQIIKSLPKISPKKAQQMYSAISDNEVTLYKFQIHVLKKLSSLLNNNGEYKSTLAPNANFVKQRAMEQKLRVSKQMVEEITCELQRLCILPPYWRMLNSPLMHRNEDLIRIRNNLKTLVDPTVKFDSDLEMKVKAGLKECERNVGSLRIVETERIKIVQAVGLKQGQWYKCPKGHIYCLTDTVKTMAKRKCPDCRISCSAGTQ